MKVLLVSADRSTLRGTANNLGDALLTDALAERLREGGFIMSVADFGGPRSVGPVGRSHVVGVAGLLRAISDADAVVVGGGTLLQDDAGRGFQGLPRLLFAVAWLARFRRKPVAFFGLGCDPVKRWLPKWLLRSALRAGPIWLRDEASQQRCRQQFGVIGRLGADTSLLFLDRLTRIERTASASGDVIVALNGADSGRLGLAEADLSPLAGKNAVFLSMYQGIPISDATTIPAQVVHTFAEITAGLSWEHAVQRIADAQAVYASRMHAMYIALMVGTPILAVSSSPKVESFAREFGVPSTPTVNFAGNVPAIGDSRALIAAADRAEKSAVQLIRQLKHWRSQSQSRRKTVIEQI